MGLKRTELCEAVVGGLTWWFHGLAIPARTWLLNCLFIPTTVELWDNLMAAGTPLGMLPCGLMPDLLRTESGLPLYGHEMAGDTNFGVVDGFRLVCENIQALVHRQKRLPGSLPIRQRRPLPLRRQARAHVSQWYPVLDAKGKVIGRVTAARSIQKVT